MTQAAPNRQDGRFVLTLDPQTQMAVNLLFLAAAPLAFTLGTQSGWAIMTGVGMLALFLAGLWLIADGLRTEKALTDGTRQTAPRMPRKLLGALHIGGAIGAMTFIKTANPLPSAALALLSVALCSMAFGRDNREVPIHAAEGSAGVAAAIEEARELIAQMREALHAVDAHEVLRPFDEFDAAADHLFNAVREDPSRAMGVSRFLGDYLDGVIEATAQHIEAHSSDKATVEHAWYIDLLTDLAQQYETRAADYLRDAGHAEPLDPMSRAA